MKTRIVFIVIAGLILSVKGNSVRSSGMPEDSFQLECDTNLIADNDGNVYKTVQIGTQTWMAENLKTTKLNDGTLIPLVSDYTRWSSLNTAAYCWYNNDFSNKNMYGALYNYYPVETEQLCPTGWHVPNDDEWNVLKSFLGDSTAGGKLKEPEFEHWPFPNTGANNISGFTALPGRSRSDYGGFIANDVGAWWSATPLKYWYVTTESENFFEYGMSHRGGESVRCLKDEEDTTKRVDLQKGLIAYYPFNGNANDESVSGHNGIVNGATLTTDRFDLPNSAYNFNGIDNFIEIPDNKDINFGETVNFTINLWFKLLINQGNGCYGLITKGTDNSDVYSLDMTLGQYPTVRFIFGEGNESATVYRIDNVTVEDNCWHMVTAKAIRDNNTLQLYQDGVLIAEMTLESISDFNMSSNASLKIGVGRLFYYYFGGNLDDIRIYNRALNTAEIQALYSENKVTISTPELCVYRNSLFEIPVNANNISVDNNVISYQFDYNYDNKKIQYLDYSLSGTLVENENVQIYPQSDKLSIAWAGPSPLSESGMLINLQFKALETGSTTPFISNCLLNADTVKDITNGTITINMGYGDVDSNKFVQAYDAALTLQYSVGLDPLPVIDPLPWEEWRTTAANVDGQGSITAYDASLILQYVVGSINSFPAEDYKMNLNTPQADVTLSIEDRFIVFRSQGELHGLNVSEQENPELLNLPRILDSRIFSATNSTETTYAVGLAITQALRNNEILMKIPFDEVNKQGFIFDMIVNNHHKQVTIGPITGIEKVENNSFFIYPNPSDGSFFIDMSKEYPNSMVTITTQDGRIIQREERDNMRIIDIKMVAPQGIYLVTITTDKETAVFKIVKN